MSDRPSHLANLPPMTGPGTAKVFLLRELGYVTLIIRLPDGTDAGVFTLHRAEAGKLASRIQELLNTAEGANTFVEGVHLGGPPTAQQLMPLGKLIHELRACPDLETTQAADASVLRDAELPPLHKGLLGWSNGLMAYAGYFRLFPLTSTRSSPGWLSTIGDWNLKSTWKFAWPESVTDYVCFGETAWGDQYAYRRDELERGDSAPVYKLEAIAMQPEQLAGSFEEFLTNDFLRNCRAPYDDMLVRAREKVGPVRATEHIVYVPSLLLSGTEDVDHVVKMDAVSAMIANGDMATQLQDELQSREVERVDTYRDDLGRTRLKVIWRG